MLRVTFEETSTFYSDKTTLQQYLSVFDGFTHLLNHLFCEMGLFTLQNCCVSWSLSFLKLKPDSQSRLTIPEFSG